MGIILERMIMMIIWDSETWFQYSRSQRLGLFENVVQMIIFRPKRDEVAGGWRKLHNEELHFLYSSQSIIT
jgi:hypothetical protein